MTPYTQGKCLMLIGTPKTITHGCTSCKNLEMEPKYLTKSDVQLKPNISKKKKKKEKR